MYICIYVYIYINITSYIYIYIGYMCIYTYIKHNIFHFSPSAVATQAQAPITSRTCVTWGYKPLFLNKFLSQLCVYIYIYISKYIYIYIYIYTYRNRVQPVVSRQASSDQQLRSHLRNTINT